MRLSQIKLAGFKSFVDPTVLHFPTNLTGVVGPNGCGKSNVIDAVRWVMGESSAKYLRGDSLADVIFNGSAGRKPVGVASIELVFDNSDGAIGGPYAKFSEVAVKRTLSRDGVSVYYINGTRCRRRDVMGLFLGTGLGPRSYSIIEQGMVSRLIEARPEDMRAYLEEAAGISRYKERRRETANRIRHTRENLERLTDLRDEVDKQLKHLQRQARVAERYREYRARERKYQAELALLRLRELDEAHQQQHLAVEQQQTAVDGVVAALRAIERQLEQAQANLAERQDAANEAQEAFYRHGAEITRVEQEIRHARDLRERQTDERQRLRDAIAAVEQDLAADREQLRDGETSLAELQPALEQARGQEAVHADAVEAAQVRLTDWQRNWDDWSGQTNEARQSLRVEETRLEGHESRLQSLRSRVARLRDTRASLALAELEGDAEQAAGAVEVAEQTLASRRRELAQTSETVERLRQEQGRLGDELHEIRGRLESVSGQVSSLKALQQAALGADDTTAVQQWLRERGIADNPRLAQRLQVDAGWEQAVEAVLGDGLEAVCVDGLAALAGMAGRPDGERLVLFEGGGAGAAAGTPRDGLMPLLDRLGGDMVPVSLLQGVYCAEDMDEALRLQRHLAPGESLVTRDGQRLGRDWARLGDDADPRAGVIAREQALREKRELRAGLDAQRQRLQAAFRERQQALEDAEADKAAQQEAVNAAHTLLAENRGRVDALAARLEQMRQQLAAVDGELAELAEQERELDESIARCRDRADEARDRLDALLAREQPLRASRGELEETLEQARSRAATSRAEAQRLALEVQSLTSQQASLREATNRLEQQLAQYQSRAEVLDEQMEHEAAPVRDLEAQLEELLQGRGALEATLREAREAVEAVEAEQRRLRAERSDREGEVEEARAALESKRLRLQEVVTRRATCLEALEGFEATPQAIAEAMDEDAAIPAWEEELANIARRIERLGPINLAAIDEYQTQLERKEYLDSQHSDLSQALDTLEDAMRKIDRETRTRFKETFDRVDAGLKRIYPRLFGGGHAYLELTDDDLLSAGVTVMARPPGKRNSTIHQLSGGEKAMTAVALIFSIFELNPAPFCMLDEVDAPLDDANVGRFCQIVREMSERVQFIFITHNKVTMEMASHLSGVTMQEPGVSRLVAVDVDEAVKLAAM